MKYILEFLREHVGIQPVEGAMVRHIEEFEGDVPIGYRFVINDRETDIVVWFADYDTWLEKKYDRLQNDYHKLMRMLPKPEPELDNHIAVSELTEAFWNKND